MADVNTVFFDVGSTLLHPFPSVVEVCCEVFARAGHRFSSEELEPHMALVDEYYEDQYRQNDAFWADEIETSRVWEGMYAVLCNELGLMDEASHLARQVYVEFGQPNRWAPYDDVMPALERLRAKGISVGVISNWDTRLARILEGLGIENYLDDVISSAAVGLRKPDRRIFELACSRIGTTPEHAAHVGDHHYADYYGATRAGMRAVLIDRGASDSANTGIHTLDVLDEVLGL